MEMQPTPICAAAFLALHASLRAGEVCAVQWRDVDLNNKTIRVNKAVGLGEGGAYLKTTKNDASNRDVDITADLAKKLEERCEAMQQELKNANVMLSSEQFGNLYVCGTIDGRYLNPQILTRKWGAVAEAFNIIGTEGKRASFHTLRHGYATVGIASGIDVASIAAQMGHSTTSQTLNTYTSATADGKRRAALTMNDVMHPNNEADILTLEKTGTEG
jgi:integrase